MKDLQYTRSDKIAGRIERAVLLLDKGFILVPLKRGEWEKYSEDSYGDRRCSNCHDYYTDEPENLRYCPRCGAKMKKYTRGGWQIPRNLYKPAVSENIERHWTPISKCAPKKATHYWVRFNDGKVGHVWFDTPYFGKNHWVCKDSVVEKITHWAPFTEHEVMVYLHNNCRIKFVEYKEDQNGN